MRGRLPRHPRARPNIPAKTYGYAPPCLVAGGTHGTVIGNLETTGRWPKFVRVGGASWTAGKWRVRHRQVKVYDDSGVWQATYEKSSARRIGHKRQRVTWHFVS